MFVWDWLFYDFSIFIINIRKMIAGVEPKNYEKEKYWKLLFEVNN